MKHPAGIKCIWLHIVCEDNMQPYVLVARHPKETASGRFCRLPSIPRKLSVAGSVGENKTM